MKISHRQVIKAASRLSFSGLFIFLGVVTLCHAAETITETVDGKTVEIISFDSQPIDIDMKDFENKNLKIKMKIPDDWSIVKTNLKNNINPLKITVKINSETVKNKGMRVYCFNDVSNRGELRKKITSKAFSFPQMPKLVNSWGRLGDVTTGADYSIHIGYTQTLVTSFKPGTAEITGQKTVTSRDTFYLIAQPATSPNGCQYGVLIHETDANVDDQPSYGFSKEVIAITQSLK